MIGLMVCLLKPIYSVHISTLGRFVVCDVTYHRMTQHANVDTLSRLPIPYQQTRENSEVVIVFSMKQMDSLPVTAGHLKRERGRDTSVKEYVQSGWPKAVEDILLVCFDKCHD